MHTLTTVSLEPVGVREGIIRSQRQTCCSSGAHCYTPINLPRVVYAYSFHMPDAHYTLTNRSRYIAGQVPSYVVDTMTSFPRLAMATRAALSPPLHCSPASLHEEAVTEWAALSWHTGADTVKHDTSDGTRTNRVWLDADAIRGGPGRPLANVSLPGTRWARLALNSTRARRLHVTSNCMRTDRARHTSNAMAGGVGGPRADASSSHTRRARLGLHSSRTGNHPPSTTIGVYR